MVIVEAICPADAQGNTWRVVCRNDDGAVVEFRTSSAELAVDQALRVLSRSRKERSNAEGATQTPHSNVQVVDQGAEQITRAKRRRSNRVASDMAPILTHDAISCGQRMVKRRIELNLTQARVAARVTFEAKTATRRPVQRPLARNTYAMYELDAAEPSLKTLEGIAAALSVSPAWLAFGIGHRGPRAARLVTS